MKRIVLRKLLACSLCLLVGAGVLGNPDQASQGQFIRGDTDNSARLNIVDVTYLLEFLFRGGKKLHCFEAGDANDDGAQDVSDAAFLLQYLFLGTAAPPAPFPYCDHDPLHAPCGKSICN